METSPYSNIGQRRIDFWDEDNLSLSLFPYKPGKSGETDEATQFILRFNAFDPAFDSACVQAAALQVHSAVRNHLERLKDEYGCRHIVPVPRHIAHEVSPSSKFVCRFIAKTFPWLQYPEELVFRKETVVAAHQAYAGKRPTSMNHFESLGCSRADLHGAGVLLFDDVRTAGDTSQGCIRRLKLDSKCGVVVRLFLGRTEVVVRQAPRLPRPSRFSKGG